MTLDFFAVENTLEEYRKKRGNSHATTNRRKAALGVMFKQAQKLFPHWKPPVVEKKRESKAGRTFRFLPALERDMLQWALAYGNVDFYDFLVLSMYLGQRENETLRLRFAESPAHRFDGYIDDGFAVFPASDNDNKSIMTHAVPLRPTVEEVINRRRQRATDERSRVWTV